MIFFDVAVVEVRVAAELGHVEANPRLLAADGFDLVFKLSPSAGQLVDLLTAVDVLGQRTLDRLAGRVGV